MRVFKILSILIAVCVLTGCILPREEELLPPDLLQPEEVRFRTIEVQRGTIQDILEDSLVAVSAVHYELSFHNRSGYLAELNVLAGMQVKEGDVLARLDTGPLENDIIRQRIFVEKSQLTLEEITRSRGSRFARRHAELDLELAELMLRQLEEELEQTTIVSPIDGEIVFVNDFRVGGFVPGRSTLLVIADPHQIQFEYTGNQVSRIRAGMAADIVIDSVTIPATVTMTPATAPQEERERVRNTVIFSPDNLDDLPENIRRGSRHRFSIFMQEKENVIVIPVSSLSTFMGQHFAQILEDGIRTERDLNTGIMTDTLVEVISGLDEGDLLIIGIDR